MSSFTENLIPFVFMAIFVGAMLILGISGH